MKGNKVSSPFFKEDDRMDPQCEGGDYNMYPVHQMHSAAAAERREDIKSDYLRNRYDPIG